MISFLIRIFTSGKRTNQDGYVVHRPIRGRQKLEHRQIASQILRRKLLPGEVVHHINGKRNDNNPENLCVMFNDAHKLYHGWYKWMKKRNGVAPKREAQLRRLIELRGIFLVEHVRKIS